jgi:hypothetical protein
MIKYARRYREESAMSEIERLTITLPAEMAAVVKSTLRLTDTAEADLAKIWAYVSLEASEATATRLLDKIKEAVPAVL